ncbi:MAG: HEAT repeat domain-containing protein [Candidatus Riflebacteria bacterium]|nr:HEAT repeat domain-containing protein [Candidatus Riflebacteria bacterium]
MQDFELGELLDGVDEQSALAALDTVARGGQREMMGVVVGRLGRPASPTLLAAMLRVLGYLGGPNDGRIVAAFIENDDEVVRATALRAMARMRASGAFPLMIRAVATDPSERVRAAVAQVLAPMPATAIQNGLLTMLKSSRDWPPLAAVQYAESVLGERGSDLLIAALEASNSAARDLATRALQQLASRGHQGSVDALSKAMPAVRPPAAVSRAPVVPGPTPTPAAGSLRWESFADPKPPDPASTASDSPHLLADLQSPAITGPQEPVPEVAPPLSTAPRAPQPLRRTPSMGRTAPPPLEPEAAPEAPPPEEAPAVVKPPPRRLRPPAASPGLGGPGPAVAPPMGLPMDEPPRPQPRARAPGAAGLLRKCPVCGTECDTKATFCSNCGESLAPGAARRPVPAGAAAAASGGQPSRPAGIFIIGALGILGGCAVTLGGLFALDKSPGVGIFLIALAVVQFLLAFALLRGSNTARRIQIGLACFGLLSLQPGAMIVNLIFIWYLQTETAKAYCCN